MAFDNDRIGRTPTWTYIMWRIRMAEENIKRLGDCYI